jgi:hypothetical protein
MKKHICSLGQYWHSSSELVTFSRPKDIDGMGSLFPLIFFNFCPICGKNLKADIKKYFGERK